MLKKRDYEMVIHFLECYYCQTFVILDALKQQSDDFALRETKERRDQLKNELMQLRQKQLRQNSLDDINYFMQREAGRRFNEKEFNHLIDTILSSLQDVTIKRKRWLNTKNSTWN